MSFFQHYRSGCICIDATVCVCVCQLEILKHRTIHRGYSPWFVVYQDTESAAKPARKSCIKFVMIHVLNLAGSYSRSCIKLKKLSPFLADHGCNTVWRTPRNLCHFWGWQTADCSLLDWRLFWLMSRKFSFKKKKDSKGRLFCYCCDKVALERCSYLIPSVEVFNSSVPMKSVPTCASLPGADSADMMKCLFGAGAVNQLSLCQCKM